MPAIQFSRLFLLLIGSAMLGASLTAPQPQAKTGSESPPHLNVEVHFSEAEPRRVIGYEAGQIELPPVNQYDGLAEVPFPVLIPQYIPSGYVLYKAAHSKRGSEFEDHSVGISLKNGNHFFVFEQTPKKPFIDEMPKVTDETDRYAKGEATIRGAKGNWEITNDMTTVVWQEGQICYTLSSGELSLNELLQFAENLIPLQTK